MQPYLTLDHVSLSFGKQLPLFSDLSFQFPAKQWTSILGKSGAGKSYLLRYIAGLCNSTNINLTGKITYQQQSIQTGQISYLSQQSGLLPWLSVIENIVLSHRLRGTLNNVIYQKAKDILTQINLLEYRNKRPNVLSGGMKQRVQLARVLLDQSNIVLLDEPFSALDQITRFSMQTLAYQLLKNKTVILVTHDPLEALRLSDRIVILSGKPANLSAPIHINQTTPRKIDDPALLKQQAQLIKQLTKEESLV